MTAVKTVWCVGNDHVIHYANCDEIVLRTTPYYAGAPVMGDDGKPTTIMPKTATEMLAHIGRNDFKDHNAAPSILTACKCITETAEREPK